MAIEGAAATRGIPWLSGATEANWDAVYRAQLPRIYNFFRYRIGDRAEVEDLSSITFEKAWCARHRYRRDRGGFTARLFIVARNVAVDHFRSARHDAPLEHAAGTAAGSSPEDQTVRRSDFERLAALLAVDTLSGEIASGVTQTLASKPIRRAEIVLGNRRHRGPAQPDQRPVAARGLIDAAADCARHADNAVYAHVPAERCGRRVGCRLRDRDARRCAAAIPAPRAMSPVQDVSAPRRA